MTQKANKDIRNLLKKTGMAQWELAELLNMAESTLCVKLRRELPEEEQQKIIAVIQGCSKGGE